MIQRLDVRKNETLYTDVLIVGGGSWCCCCPC